MERERKISRNQTRVVGVGGHGTYPKRNKNPANCDTCLWQKKKGGRGTGRKEDVNLGKRGNTTGESLDQQAVQGNRRDPSYKEKGRRATLGGLKERARGR